MRNALFSVLLSTVIVPALMLVPPVKEPEAKNQSDWPVIPVEPEVVPTPIPDPVPDALPAPASFAPESSIDEQAKELEALADEIRAIAGKVRKDADRAKEAADEAKKNADFAMKSSEGMKSYVPAPSDTKPLTEARVIELIDQRIKELKIECKCVATGKTELKSVKTTVDSRGVAVFDVPAGGVLTGYQDVYTGAWVTVNRSSMTTSVVPDTQKPVVIYQANGSEYREIPAKASQPVRAAIRFALPGSQGTCRTEIVNGVKTRVCD